MSLLLNRRHTLAIGIAALLLFAAVAPLCLMPMSSAMAMPQASTLPAQPVQDCGGGAGAGGGSMTACPLMNGDDVPAATPANQDSVTSLVAVPAVPVQLATPETGRGVVDERACLAHAGAPLTRLRL